MSNFVKNETAGTHAHTSAAECGKRKISPNLFAVGGDTA